MPLPRRRRLTQAASPRREVERAPCTCGSAPGMRLLLCAACRAWARKQVLLVDGTLVQSMVWVGWNEMQQQERTPR
jgi:hypothetical protein